jgi:ferrochelatase
MQGCLLINLGTPDDPKTSSVRRYLREFLSDPRVLDINPVGRFFLLELAILPTRPKKSGEAYEKIWTDRGSPLLFHSQDLADAVAKKLGSEWRVKLAMRYQKPSIAAALDELDGLDRIVVVPLYPQYSSAATGSTVEEVCRLAARRWVTPSLAFVPPFYDDPGYIWSFAARARPILDEQKPDHVLFSYHGLPERHCTRTDRTGAHCLKSETCCDGIVDANRDCYRAQCYATTRALAAALGLSSTKYSVSFQSRLGRTPWIRPYTDVVLPELAAAGKKNVVVFSPAFVADCLETLEEIGIRARADFESRGGNLTLVPSLNAMPEWVDAVVEMIKRA